MKQFTPKVCNRAMPLLSVFLIFLAYQKTDIQNLKELSAILPNDIPISAFSDGI